MIYRIVGTESIGKRQMQEKSTDRRRAVTADYRFGDVESFEASFRGLDLDLRQLDCGSFRGYLRVVSTPCIVLSECALNRKIEQHGAPQSGYWTFGIPIGDGFRMRWRGKEVDSEGLTVFRPDEEIDCKSDARFHAFAVMVPERRLVDAAERHGVSSIDELIGHDNVLRLPKPSLAALRERLSGILEAASANSRLLAAPAFLTEIEDDFCDRLFDETSQARQCESRPMARVRSNALRKALAIIHERSDDPIQVADLERLCEISSRTLRYAFLEEFGVPPKQYLLAFRLNQVRRRLVEEGPRRGRISDAANDGGFWHMGEFAALYRRMFAELPSQTIHKKPVRFSGSDY